MLSKSKVDYTTSCNHLLRAALLKREILPPRGLKCCLDDLTVFPTGRAGVAQLVELQPSKLNVASSSLVSRSIIDFSKGAAEDRIRPRSSVGRALPW